MKIVECPRCRDEVTVPARARARSLVRCPLCLEEYLLREALAELPPMLEVLDGSGGEEDDGEADLVGAGAPLKAAAGAIGDVGDEYRVAGGGFGGVLDSSPAAGVTVSTAARPAVKGARPKRKERSALVEMAKVVAGGIVGCILAPLVLWWGFGNDALNLGPKVAPYAPWAVPAKFHGKPASTATDSAGAGQAIPSSNNVASVPPPTKEGNDTSSQQGNGLIGELPTDLPYSDPTKFDPSLVVDDPLQAKGGLGAGPAEPNPAPFNPEAIPAPPKTTKKGKSEKTKPVEPEPVEPETTVPEPMPVAEPALPIEPPAVAEKTIPSANDFAQAVVAAADALAKVNDQPEMQPREVRQQLFTDMYLAAADVGRIVTYLSTSDSDLIEHVNTLQTFLTSLAAQPGKVSALKALTDLKLPERKHDEGVLVAGSVQDFKASGSMFELTTLAGKKGTETPVICANNPQDFCAPGDELLIVGRVVENPKKHIPGYEGDHERVVLYGYSVKVPKAAAGM
jgi:hypothetical protein